MRKCGVLTLTVLAALASFAPGSASAQFVFLGAGPSFPIGDYGDYGKTGFLAAGGIGFPVGPEGVRRSTRFARAYSLTNRWSRATVMG